MVLIMNVLTDPVLKLKAEEGLSSMQPRVTVTLQNNSEGRAVYTKLWSEPVIRGQVERRSYFHFAGRDEIVTKDGTIFALEPRNKWRTGTDPAIDMYPAIIVTKRNSVLREV